VRLGANEGVTVRKFFLCLLLGALAGCAGTQSDNVTSSGNGSTGAGTSAGSTSAAASGSATGRESTAGASTGTSSGSAATTGGSTSASSGSSTGGQTSTGSSTGGSSSGGSSSGGSSTGSSAITLAQACTDYLAGDAVVDGCMPGGNPLPTEQECETLLAVCTAQDLATIDAVGLCFENLVCGANFESNFAACIAEIMPLTKACNSAGETTPDGGIEDPDGGIGDPDGGSGETTTTGGGGR
jgi:hypothetical protein